MAHPSLKCKNLLFVRLIFQQPNYECPFRFSKESRKKPAFLPTKKREKNFVWYMWSGIQKKKELPYGKSLET